MLLSFNFHIGSVIVDFDIRSNNNKKIYKLMKENPSDSII